jgi:hypothetical protein
MLFPYEREHFRRTAYAIKSGLYRNMKKEVPTGYYFSPLYRANQDFEIISAASALLSEKKAHKIILTGQLSSDIYC